MSEQTAETKKEYPGGIERWNTLKGLAQGARESGDMQSSLILEVATELAGLAYILDGIRYSARKVG